MTDQHPITPPPELVQQWIAEIWHEGTRVQVAQSDLHLAARAAQWGDDQRGEVNEVELQQARDQELEACCKWLENTGHWALLVDLRAARRPKPLNLKDLALSELETILNELHRANGSILTASAIRRALEALPDD